MPRKSPFKHDVLGNDTDIDVDPVLAADLTANVAHPQTQRAGQDLVTVFGRPDDVIAMIKNAVFAGVILHDLILGKNEPWPNRRLIFPEDKIITRFFALKQVRLEVGGLYQ